MSKPLAMPPVNRDHNPLLCDHGVFAVFQDEMNGGQIEMSILCELVPGHDGPHFAEGAGTWIDEDNSDPFPG